MAARQDACVEPDKGSLFGMDGAAKPDPRADIHAFTDHAVMPVRAERTGR